MNSIARPRSSAAVSRAAVIDEAPDGAGSDTSTTPRGSGLQGITDRLAALGGELGIHSQPGHGTTLTCKLPVGDLAGGRAAAGLPGSAVRDVTLS
jgi:glucose-6-phosphate-specific signal transduction histidine kinase